MGSIVRCLVCGDEIESKSLHDFRCCSCGNVCIDGGNAYTKLSFVDYSKIEMVDKNNRKYNSD